MLRSKNNFFEGNQHYFFVRGSTFFFHYYFLCGPTKFFVMKSKKDNNNNNEWYISINIGSVLTLHTTSTLLAESLSKGMILQCASGAIRN